ncbi:gamma-glutamylcyclotransferase [Paenibacillus solisilvae]|uniref:Gamma-glutamylcyclotransferase n=1 Tax=Paenibacillus solisilvae TaxID=2486751 RepID=A0ABW0VT66_9BACL
MKASRHTVFIYGSLLPGHSNHEVVSASILASRPGRIAGRLVDYGPYPALLRDQEAALNNRSVRGLWIEVDAPGLIHMDELEGFLGIEESNDYHRVWVTDLDVPEQHGWVYIWDSARDCISIEDDYWPVYYARKNGA